MRTIPVLTLVAIVTAGAVYYLFQNNEPAKRADATTPSISSISNMDLQDTPIRDGSGEHLSTPARPRVTLLQEKIAALEAKLRHMETAVSEQARNVADSRADKPVSDNGAEQAKAQDLSEGDFSDWMDEALDAGYTDRDATRVAMDQVETSLAKVPGINLADMQCNERFCRATLVQENSKALNISRLIGASPFIGSGTTIHQPDGSVKVYFTPPGQSLSKLRREAKEVVLGDIHPE